MKADGIMQASARKSASLRCVVLPQTEGGVPTMLKRFLILFFNIASLVLELLPFGIPFVSSGGGPGIVFKTSESSYWAELLYLSCCANITLICTGLLLIFVILFVFIFAKKSHSFLFVFCIVTAVMGTVTMIYCIWSWIDAHTLVSVGVALLLWAESVLIKDFMNKTYGKAKNGGI